MHALSRIGKCQQGLAARNTNMVVTGLQMAAHHLAKTRGSIVNISSVASYRPEAGALAYCVSKAGLDMLTRGTAQELAPKVCPPEDTSKMHDAAS